jgi:uncharacterized glyoxalase superfamily protein PhnB
MNTLNSTAEVAAATTAELVTTYNHYATTPVKKFSDRKTAERRVIALYRAQTGEDMPATFTAPVAPVVNTSVVRVKGLEDQLAVMEVDAEQLAANKAHARRAAGNEAISASWDNPEVRAARTSRIAISVNGEEYTSVRAAFVALGLPLGRHIRFRGALRAAGQVTDATGNHWKVISITASK